MGDGAAALSNASTAVFIEKYDLAGAMVGTPIALPTAVNGAQRAFAVSGSATSEGALALSGDGHYATMGGYDAAPGTASINGTTAATVNRVVARIDATGNVDTSTALDAAFSGNNCRSAVSLDGTTMWVGGNGSGGTGGVWTTTFGAIGGTQILTAPGNVRWLGVFGGQLYAGSGSGGFTQIFSVGAGLPTTAGQTAVLTAGMPTTGGNPYGFVFFDMDPNVAGVDTFYQGDDNSVANGGGIQKWTFDGTTWTKVLTIAPPDAAAVAQVPVRGLTGYVNGGMVTLIGTTSESPPNRVFSVVDDGTTTPAFTVLATAATNTAFRGVSISPQ